MSIVEEYIEGAGVSYITADDVEDGDRFKIKNVVLDEKSFEKPYINVTVDKEGEDAIARLGVKNVTRIAEKLSTDEKAWIGKYLIVLTTEYYKGLKKTGILWTGAKK